MINISEKKNCCGCTACVAACPKQAITMVEDEKGFKYPKVDMEKCVQCGLCTQACAFSKNEQFSFGEQPIAAYAIKHRNEEIRAKSRSGGVYTAITDYVLDKGGCVFGSVICDDYVVRHQKAESKEQRDAQRGSKYVQSDMGDVFREVRKELQSGRLVVFSGTGCQVAGLRSFLKKEYDNLIAFDLVCHGVPSPKIWKDYIALMMKKYRRTLSEVQFRDKSFLGWDMHIESFKVGKKKVYSRNYSTLFNKDHILRDSCFHCKYTSMKRTGDFTLADFWGVDKHIKGFNDNKGVSLLFVNSLKAEKLFSQPEIRENLLCECCNSFNFVHPNLKHPQAEPVDRDVFWKEYKEKGIVYILRKYSTWNFTRSLQAKKSYAMIYLKRKILKMNI